MHGQPSITLSDESLCIQVINYSDGAGVTMCEGVCVCVCVLMEDHMRCIGP